MGSSTPPTVNFIDIRSDKSDISLLGMLEDGLHAKSGPTSMPTLLLYDEKGLKLFEKITYLRDYYLTNAEIETLTKHADAIVARIPVNARLLELGSGNLRKVKILLDACERAHRHVEYYALDLSFNELQRTFDELDTTTYHYVAFNALHGTYDDGLAWLAKPDNQEHPTCVLSLGSSIGNFARDEAAKFLSSFKDVMKPTDFFLIGMDSCDDADRIFVAYNDSEGVTEQFYRNGLDSANKILGENHFKQEDWAIEGLYDRSMHKHVASYICQTDTNIAGVSFKKGDRIHLEDAHKYTEDQAERVWRDAGLVSQTKFGNNRGDYYIHLLSPSVVKFDDAPELYAAHPAPSLSEWRQLWSAWDTVTRSMVPRDELLNKPIQLRNNLIFYLGHIPTFADLHYTRATGTKLIDPTYFATIFERGIDPGTTGCFLATLSGLTEADVEDPEKCHDHSMIPNEWPPLNEILDHAVRVRARITESIESGRVSSNRKLSRALWLAYEHEAMHLETFLYMLLQSERVLPPPGRRTPDFGALGRDAALKRDVNKWHHIPTSQVHVGLNDAENDDPPDRYFGWDNERPAREITVPEFQAQSRCISIRDYCQYLEATQTTGLPTSWTTITDKEQQDRFDTCPNCVQIDDANANEELKDPSSEFLEGKAVRTVYGPVAMKHVLDWPVMASYDELAAYAQWAQGRIPTFEEAKSIYQYVEEQKKEQIEKIPSALISAVNGHLSNNGVQETPPSNPSSQPAAEGTTKGIVPSEHFINLTGRNVAFKAWHPVSVTADGDRLRGQSEAGGLWEWTSSPLAAFNGFQAMDLYPGYTSDFFDGKHNICLGGSWSTVPRIAGRKSFVNWYQRNYPFTWATARLVRNVE